MNGLNRSPLAVLTMVALTICSACRGTPTPPPPSPDAAVLLRMAPPAGQVTRYRTTMETTTEMAGMPTATGPITMTQTMYQTNTVLEAVGDRRRISSVIDEVQMVAPGMAGMMGQEERMAEMMEGFAMEVVMTTRGEILSVEMPDSSPAAEMLRALECRIS